LPELDIFIDLTSHAVTPAVFSAAWNMPRPARRVTVAVKPGEPRGPAPPGSTGWTIRETSGVIGLKAALSAAGRDGAPLLVVAGVPDLEDEAVSALRHALERDPMFGFAVARVGCAERCCVARLSRHGLGETSWLPRRALSELPPTEVFVEVAAPCVLVGARVAANFEPDLEYNSTVAAMLAYMAAARRAGFRVVMCNRAVIGVQGLTCPAAPVQVVPAPPSEDRKRLAASVPDLERAWVEFRAGSWERFERLRQPPPSDGRDPRRSLLIDVRNVGPTYNGTTHAVMSIADALRRTNRIADLALLATPQAAAFHDMSAAFPGCRIYTDVPDRTFSATLRPSQPWTIPEMVDLHQLALFNIYLMLDAISWDVVYPAPRHLDGTWQFLSEHADGLLFDSEFTRRRFLGRFPAADARPNLAVLFSCDAADYVRDDVGSASEPPFILVVGNSLDHKDVHPTVVALASAFPFKRIKALGPADAGSPLVTAQQSGRLTEREVHALYAHAEYVVYPSFYEGFGFPVVTALAYGRTVLVRRSSLVDELAAGCGPGGRLITFDRREELVDLLGRLVHGEAVPDQPLGGCGRSGATRSWHQVADEIVSFVDSLIGDPSSSRWIARERAVRQLLAFGATRV
jgi:glycosyltransferase involved in cell wall biosynthesis